MLFGLDQGAIVTLDGGGTWSSWYNQSTEQIYHLSIDNSVPVLGVRHAAGRRRHAHAHPRQPRRDHAARLESGVRLGMGNDHSRSARPEHGVRQRLGHPQDLVSDRAMDQRQPGAGSDRASCARRVAADRLRAVEQHMLHRRLPVGVDDDRRRRALDGDQPRPRRAPRRAAPPPTRGGPPRRRAARSSRCRRRPSAGHDLGRHEQRADQGHARRRQDLGRRVAFPDIPNAPRAEVLSRRRVALRRRRQRTPSLGSIPRRRLHAVLLSARTTTARRGRASRTGCATNQPSGSFARVVRNDPKRRGLLFAGTESGMYVSFDDGDHWQSLQLESADDVVPRHRDQGQRPRRRDVRPRLLGDRRLLDAASAHAGDRQRAGASVQAGRRGPHAPQRRRRHAVPARDAARAQSAGRRR